MTPSTKESPASLTNLSIVAIDPGTKRIGFAIKPPGALTVVPCGVVEFQSDHEGIIRAREFLAARAPDLVVVGLPISPDMTQAARVKRFTRKLRAGHHGARWRFADESLTSEAAAEKLCDAGLDRRGARVDDLAAVLILESYLLANGLTPGGRT